MDMTREYFLSTFQLSQNPTEPIYSQLAEYLAIRSRQAY